MAKKERFDDLANSVIELVGGKENIIFFTHCVTRLRFNLKDRGLVKMEDIEKIPGVLGCQWSGEQLQIIIGQAVGDAYALICEKTGLVKQAAVEEKLDDEPKKKLSFNTIMDAISGCITPCIPVLIGCGMVKIIILICEMCGILAAGNPTHTVLTFVGDAGFYFLPIMIGAFTARKYGGNMALGMMLGAMFIHPSFIASITEGTALSVFGIPVYAAGYSSTIFPALLTVIVMCYVEKFIAKHSPDAIRSVTEPLFTILVMVPLGLYVLGPIGSFLGNYVAAAVMWLYEHLGFIGIAVLASVLPWLVLTGMQTGIAPYLLNAFATVGYDPIIITANVVSNVDQGAACLAVALRTKDKNLRSTALSCAITAIIGGVTEPAMFGVTFKLKKPLYGAMIGSFIGGAIAGIGKVYCYAFVGSGGIFAIPAFISERSANLLVMVAAMIVGMIVTFFATLILYKED